MGEKMDKKYYMIRLVDAKYRYPERKNEWDEMTKKGVKPGDLIRIDVTE